jgi:intracellular septation protein
MKLLYDFFPIVVFFIIFKLYGIYAATFAAIVVSVIQVVVYWLKHRQFEKMQLVTLGLIVILGGATLIFHDDMFIKWKVSVVNWAFAIAFLGSQWFGKKNLAERMLSEKIVLPEKIWRKLNFSWGLYFAIIGFVNVIAIYTLSTNAWVNFKLFGVLGLTVLFVIAQAVFLSRHLKNLS